MIKRPVKVFFIFISAILLNSSCFAQNEINNWFFGSNAAIRFISGTPLAIANSSLVSFEGCSSISDSSGNLLFYTDGVTVWNKNNNIMANGNGLLGNTDCTTSATIIRQPGYGNIYYIFTIDMAALPNGVCYSVVDMSQFGGNGSVISKNNFVYQPATEKLAATCHANGSDIWIVTHEWDTNNFRSYLLTSAGLDTVPVVSGVGLVHTGSTVNTNGYMCISSQGNKLAVAICHDMNTFELFDFDNTTGVVSNAVTMNQISASIGAYGVQFSPDGSKLYGTYLDPPTIFQWNLNAGSPTAIINSQQIVSTYNSWYGALKTGPNGKIYVACNDYYLSVINNPDSLGTLCNVVNQAVYLGGKTCGVGLPSNFSGTGCTSNIMMAPVVALASSDTNFCEKQCINFFDLSTNNPTSWHWNFPGGFPDTSSMQNPTNICFNSYGHFDVKLIACNQIGCDSIVIPGFISEYKNPVDSIYMSGDTLFSVAAANYQWYESSTGLIPGQVYQFFIVTKPGSYYCVVKDSLGCIASSNSIVITSLFEHHDYNAEIYISPNPAGDQLTILYENNYPQESLIEIKNLFGQSLIQQTLIVSPITTIDVRDLPVGMYVVDFKNRNKWVIKKFVKN